MDWKKSSYHHASQNFQEMHPLRMNWLIHIIKPFSLTFLHENILVRIYLCPFFLRLTVVVCFLSWNRPHGNPEASRRDLRGLDGLWQLEATTLSLRQCQPHPVPWRILQHRPRIRLSCDLESKVSKTILPFNFVGSYKHAYLSAQDAWNPLFTAVASCDLVQPRNLSRTLWKTRESPVSQWPQVARIVPRPRCR